MKHRSRRPPRKPRSILKSDTFWTVVVGVAFLVTGASITSDVLSALESATPDVTSVQDKINQRCGTNYSLLDLATKGEEILSHCK
jgi:hypothetical protein